jgi:hypothetical protein
MNAEDAKDAKIANNRRNSEWQFFISVPILFFLSIPLLLCALGDLNDLGVENTG